MKVLFLSHYFPPEVNAPATRTMEHCRRWVAAGHAVTVVTCAPNFPTGEVHDGYENRWSEEQVDGIRVIRVWTAIASNEGFARRVLHYLSYMASSTIQALREDYDVVVATSPQFFCGWAGVLCRWARRRPFVLEIRDIWPESIVTVGAMRRSPAIRFLEVLERIMYRVADRIVTVGEGYREQLLERKVPAEKISVIPNGVDVNEVRPLEDARALRDQMGVDDQFVCAYVGSVGMAHGLEVVLDAAEQARSAGRQDLAFWIVGDGAKRAELEAAAAARGLDNIRFTGMVSKKQAAEYVGAADCCLIHLRRTALFRTVIPSKIFDAMAMRTPILMGVRGQAERIVLDAEAGVAMTPDCPISLLEGLAEIAASPDRFRQGRDYVRRHFDRAELALRMQNVMEGLCPQTVAFPAAAESVVERRRAA